MQNLNSRLITFLDTTLRDGEQAPGNAMTPEQKLDLAGMLEYAGVETIETGFPASSSADFRATQLISSKLRTASFATFSRALREDVRIAIEAGGVSDRHVIMLVATGSDLHLKHKRNITREQGLLEVVEAVKYAKGRGLKNVAVGIEDASRGESDYMEALAVSSVNAGANQIILADTTGYATPRSFYDLVRCVRGWVGPDIKISTHCHNDLGLGVANALAGIEAGANEVQATLGGIGERAGNTALEQIAAFLHYKQAEYDVHSNIRLDMLYAAFARLRQFIGLEEPRTQPLFGKYAFSTAAGIHQQGILNDPDTYEYVKPETVGRERKLLVARHSGRAVIRHLLRELDIMLDQEEINKLYEKFIADRTDNSCEDMEALKETIAKEYSGSARETPKIPVLSQ
ncbi:hypothetical protein WM40_26085 [Robbsia andropogonis]|uniref:2-isopropylmalate synthase n=1 Tax=Robbsia andropogonis TaxID=28092 RepID=A0A0F5JTH7_9BURK|nr:hypothetical protein [Robbsia andropogonis]KKB60959.1 hypothetical protein WM40_26085 [Robbsia andropogonis]